MTVKELIEKLSAMPQDLEVVTLGSEFTGDHDVASVEIVDEERERPFSREKYRAHHVQITYC